MENEPPMPDTRDPADPALDPAVRMADGGQAEPSGDPAIPAPAVDEPVAVADEPPAPQMSSAKTSSGKASSKKKPAQPESWIETVKTIFYALLIALVIRTFFFQPFNIPSQSMEATLLVGDYLFVSKFSYGYGPHSLPFTPSFSRNELDK